jgi:DNA repair photolyase
MEKKIVELSCKTLLVDVSDYPLNFLIFPHRLTANAYVGCVHDCSYCYARWYCKPNELKVKINAPEILRKELQKRIDKVKPKEPLCLGGISDPYQPIELKYQLTRKMLQVCDELSYPVFIVTKSNLVTKDKDVLSSLAKRNLVAINFTITPIEAKLLRKLEPCAPSNLKRLEAMKTLSGAGIPVNLYLSPYFPFLSENLLDYYVKKSNDCGAKCCAIVPLKIRPVIWKGVEQFLQTNVPSLVDQYKDLYFKHGSKDLLGYWLPELTYRRKIAESIAEKCKQLGMSFTVEEFIQTWTTAYSDCVDIDCWHAPTGYDFINFIKSQDLNQASIEQVIDHIKKNFQVDAHWEKMLRKYWEKTSCLNINLVRLSSPRWFQLFSL